MHDRGSLIFFKKKFLVLKSTFFWTWEEYFFNINTHRGFFRISIHQCFARNSPRRSRTCVFAARRRRRKCGKITGFLVKYEGKRGLGSGGEKKTLSRRLPNCCSPALSLAGGGLARFQLVASAMTVVLPAKRERKNSHLISGQKHRRKFTFNFGASFFPPEEKMAFCAMGFFCSVCLPSLDRLVLFYPFSQTCVLFPFSFFFRSDQIVNFGREIPSVDPLDELQHFSFGLDPSSAGPIHQEWKWRNYYPSICG